MREKREKERDDVEGFLLSLERLKVLAMIKVLFTLLHAIELVLGTLFLGLCLSVIVQ